MMLAEMWSRVAFKVMFIIKGTCSVWVNVCSQRKLPSPAKIILNAGGA